MKLSLLLWGFFQYFVQYLSILLSSLVKQARVRNNLFIMVRKSDLYKLHEKERIRN